MKLDRIKELIDKLLSDNLNSEESVELSQHKTMNTYLRKRWNTALDQEKKDEVDSLQMWKNITDECWHNNRNDFNRLKKARVMWWSGCAAAIVVIVVISTFLLNVKPEYVLVAAADKTLIYKLPDESTVWLNANSTLQYRKDFEKCREVILDGVAFFNVKKMAKNPFQINVFGGNIVVKGTSFNVQTSTAETEITLFTGLVDFNVDQLDATYEMLPNDQIVYDNINGTLIIDKVDVAEYDWRTNRYKFIEKPFSELIDFINRKYKVNITIKDAKHNNTCFTGSINKSDEVDDVIEKICFSMNLKHKHENDKIILY